MNEPAKARPDHASDRGQDAAKAMRFFALKAAIFILVPVAAAAIAVMVMLK